MIEAGSLHISKRFNRDLTMLVNQLLQMGGVVERQLEAALESLLQADEGLAQQAHELEDQVDELDLIIGEACAQVLVLRQPAATDLRMTLAINKCVSDLERMGDEANKIAKMAQSLMAEEASPTNYIEVRHIGQHVAKMLHDVLHAFSRQDVALALKVKASDEQVDIEYRSALRSLITFMMEEPKNITNILNIIWVLRALERIGDHVCNIAEQVVYMVKGRDIRHATKEEIEKIVQQMQQDNQ